MAKTPLTTPPVVVLTRPLSAPDVQEWLEQRADVRIAGEDTLAASVADAEGLIAVWPTKVGSDLLERATKLRAIATVTAGSEHVDTAAAAARGIEVITGVGAAPDAVVEWALWAMIGLSRRFSLTARTFTDDTWDWATRFSTGPSRQLSGRTLGIVGLGHIGRRLAEAASTVLGMRVVAFDPYASTTAGISLVSLDRLLERSDVVSLNLPLTDKTKSMLGLEQLRRIGPEGMLLNASRGGVVDEQALLAALQTGELGAAALDVFNSEPPDRVLIQQLVATNRVLLSPHAAGMSVEAMHALNRHAVESLLQMLRPLTAG